MGFPSVLVLYIANLILFKSDVAVFIEIWAIINTIIVGVTTPLFTYAPNLRMEFGEDLHEFDNNFFIVSFITGLLIILPVEVLILSCFSGIQTFSIFFAVSLFTVFSTSFNINNAYLISKGNYRRYFISTARYFVVSSIGLLVLRPFGFSTISSVLYIFCLGLAIGSAESIFHSIANFTSVGFRAFVSTTRKLSSLSRLSILVFISGVSNLILNGPLIFGTRIGINADQLITLGAFTNISLVFYSLLNSITSPIQTEMIANFHTHNFLKFKEIYWKYFVLYVCFTVIVSAFLSFAIEFLTKLYVDSSTDINTAFRLIFVASFGLSTISALPRIGLMMVGQYASLLKIWFGGLSVFFVSLYIPFDPFSSVVVAPTVSAVLILVSCHLIFIKHVKLLAME